MTPLAALLTRARDRIADPARWCQAVEATDETGMRCDATSPNAASWCAVGALNVSSGHRNATFYAARKALRDSARQLTDYIDVDDVNDTLGHAAVMRVYDAAIARANET